jgi:outer membrane protein assembly factor BamB
MMGDLIMSSMKNKGKEIKIKWLFIIFSLFIGCKEEKEIWNNWNKGIDLVPFPQNCSGVKNGNVSILWEFTPSSGVFVLPFQQLSVNDVDGDGKTEVIAELSDRYYVLNGEDGSILWSFQTKEGRNFFGIELLGCISSLIEDLNCDGGNEIVARCMDDNTYAFNGKDGSVLWILKTPFFSHNPMGDIDGDGRDESAGICVKMKEVDGNEEAEEIRICAINWVNDSLLWESDPIPSTVADTISLGDLNNDGVPDVVFGCGHPDEPCGVMALNGKDGSLLWKYIYPDEKYMAAVMEPPVLGDIDEDGKLEVIAVTIGEDIYVFNGEDGSLLWSRWNSPAGRDYGSIALAKTKDGFRIVGHGGVVLNKRGDVIINKKEEYGMVGYYFPIIGDVDGDGKLDTIVCRKNTEITSEGARYSQLLIYALNIEDGSEHLIYEGEKIRGTEEIVDFFLLADLNNDCILDLLVGIEESQGKYTKILALSLGVPVPPPHLLPWPMARHDVKNTGLYTGDPYPPW